MDQNPVGEVKEPTKPRSRAAPVKPASVEKPAEKPVVVAKEPAKKKVLPNWGYVAIAVILLFVLVVGSIGVIGYMFTRSAKAETMTNKPVEVTLPEVQAPVVQEPVVEAPVVQEPVVIAPVEQPEVVAEQPVTDNPGNEVSINLTQPLDLSAPEYAIPLPGFINNLEDWCYNLTSDER